MYAKLDRYKYELYFDEFDRLYKIVVDVDSNTDVDIGDISTDINSSEGRIYVEGHYARLDKMKVVNTDSGHYIVIDIYEEEER